jgi:hypothetical protein
MVPRGTPCTRLKGGSHIGKGLPTDLCNIGVPSVEYLNNYCYVIDEKVGSVDVFLKFGGAT